MILVVDCGNTYSKLAYFKSKSEYTVYDISSAEINSENSFDQIIQNIKFLGEIKIVIISSVIPSKNKLLNVIFRKITQNVYFVSDLRDSLGISYKIDDIKQLGDDRIANSFYAIKNYNSHVVVVDFGTATTYDFVNGKKQYLGGMIMPGIRLSIESLAEKTENLSNIKFYNIDNLIGMNTNDAICAGILYSNLGAIEYIYNKSCELFGQKVVMIATGGFGEVVMQKKTIINHYDPDLTLKGLFLMAVEKLK